jgi:hypothetical protein
VTLAARLAPLSEDDQGALARREVSAATATELIEALNLSELGEWARLHIVHELTHRDPALVKTIGDALVTHPEAVGAGWLGEALVELFRSHPSTRSDAVRALAGVCQSVLDSGGGSRAVADLTSQLSDCVMMGGPRPDLQPLGQRVLEIAAGESSPDVRTVLAARKLAKQE